MHSIEMLCIACASSLKRQTSLAGKRRNMGFAEAFAEVHAANAHMHSLYVQWAAVAGA